MKTILHQLIIFLFSSLFVCCNPNSSAHADNDIKKIDSYLESNNVNKESLFFYNVQSHCFICWGEGEDDPLYGLQSHKIFYINDPEMRVRPKFWKEITAETKKHIVFMVSFSKPKNEKIVNRKIMLPNDRFSFYLQSDCQGNDNKNNLKKLNIKSGYIKLESLGGDSDHSKKTVGNFTLHLSGNKFIKGRFVVKPSVVGYGP